MKLRSSTITQSGSDLNSIARWVLVSAETAIAVKQAIQSALVDAFRLVAGLAAGMS